MVENYKLHFGKRHPQVHLCCAAKCLEDVSSVKNQEGELNSWSHFNLLFGLVRLPELYQRK